MRSLEPVTAFPAESEWPRLLQKYDQPVPRYTSYPPVPAWHANPAEARAAVHASIAGDVAVYVHVPFCPSLCLYCACHRVITHDAVLAGRYVEAVAREVEAVADGVAPASISWLHWGGGTPNSLTESQAQRLFGAIIRRLPLAPGAEVSIEMDPRLATRAQIEQLARLGFNRISIGVQDFHEPTQRKINRIQSQQQTAQIIEWARSCGIAGINVDLIYGLPLQTRRTFAETVRRVLELQPDRLAVYSYAHVPWVNRAQRSYERWLPPALEKFGMLVDSIEALTTAGYQHVGIDHYALAGDPLAEAARRGTVERSFMGYAPKHAPVLLGFGASAISSAPQAFAQNAAVLEDYLSSVESGGELTRRGCVMSADDRVRQRVIEGLMTNGTATLTDGEEVTGRPFRDSFKRSLQQIESLAADGLAIVDQRAVTLTPAGRLFARNVAACFDAYATSSETGRHASAI